MSKRIIKVEITEDGELKFDNSKNSDEALIMEELGELALLLSGDPAKVKIEKHVHDHAHNHDHNHAGKYVMAKK